VNFIPQENKKINDFIQDQLDLGCKLIIERLPQAVSIVLSGSFSRAEGSYVILNDNDFNILKDFDIFIFIKNTPDVKVHENLKKLLKQQIKSSNNEKFTNNDFKINLEYININQMSKLPPEISTYELKKNGKVLHGKNLLKNIPETVSNFNTSTITRLLLNKLIGLLENHPEITQNSINTMYECHKTYIEINTALSILLKCYKLDYNSRFNALKENKNKVPERIMVKIPDLLNKIKRSLDYKLNPIDLDSTEQLNEFWHTSKEDLLIILKILISIITKNSIEDYSSNIVDKYLNTSYYLPYSQKFLSKYNLNYQFFTHFISKLYIINQNIINYPLNNIFSWQDILQKLYSTAYFLLEAIESSEKIKKADLKKAASYFKIELKSKNPLENWKLIVRNVIKIRNLYYKSKISKKSLSIF